jgi:hypothetical protein
MKKKHAVIIATSLLTINILFLSFAGYQLSTKGTNSRSLKTIRQANTISAQLSEEYKQKDTSITTKSDQFIFSNGKTLVNNYEVTYSVPNQEGQKNSMSYLYDKDKVFLKSAAIQDGYKLPKPENISWIEMPNKTYNYFESEITKEKEILIKFNIKELLTTISQITPAQSSRNQKKYSNEIVLKGDKAKEFAQKNIIDFSDGRSKVTQIDQVHIIFTSNIWDGNIEDIKIELKDTTSKVAKRSSTDFYSLTSHSEQEETLDMYTLSLKNITYSQEGRNIALKSEDKIITLEQYLEKTALVNGNPDSRFFVYYSPQVSKSALRSDTIKKDYFTLSEYLKKQNENGNALFYVPSSELYTRSFADTFDAIIMEAYYCALDQSKGLDYAFNISAYAQSSPSISYKNSLMMAEDAVKQGANLDLEKFKTCTTKNEIKQIYTQELVRKSEANIKKGNTNAYSRIFIIYDRKTNVKFEFGGNTISQTAQEITSALESLLQQN